MRILYEVQNIFASSIASAAASSSAAAFEFVGQHKQRNDMEYFNCR